MYITVVSSSAKICYIGVGDSALQEKMCSILLHDADGKISILQQYNEDFRQGLIELKEYLGKGTEDFHKIFAYFMKLQENEYFKVFLKYISDTAELLDSQSDINKINGRINILNLNIKNITSVYDWFCFGNQRKNIGEPIKTERVCRFCGKSMPEITFTKKSHAISEALGNKNAICLEECDSCNEYFGKTIEMDIINMLDPYRSLYKIKGKKGVPTTKGENFEITENLFSVVLPINNLKEINNKTFVLNNIKQKYIPQNVYRCLCKYVLSVINKKLLHEFTDTISWICGGKALNNLPLLKFCNKSKIANEPYLFVFQKKINDVNYPLLIGNLFVGAIGIFFIIPNDSCNVNLQSENFFNLLKEYPDYQNMIEKDFNGIMPVNAQYTLSIKDE